MDDVFGILLACWLVSATIGTIDNFIGQTPDARIIKMCKENGYLNVKQDRITCSVEKRNE